ncbi:MAG: DegT/DnrJ/EryC1/StrS family aminotransferase [Bacteroidota bacterium]
MVDLFSQYERIKPEIDAAIQNVIDTTAFINGPDVKLFAKELSEWLDVPYVIPCANGTDALQVAIMALDLPKGSEIIVPAFNYVATAEVIALLDMVPVFVDVLPGTFGIDPVKAEAAITGKTGAIMPVHLFGQCADMASILAIAAKHKLFVIEDCAQAIGAKYTMPDGQVYTAGAMGHVGTTSFFPSKNLGCMGDGGAIFTVNEALAARMQMIANHGQKKKYSYETIGVNSRLDTVQAALLRVKLRYLTSFTESRIDAATYYDDAFAAADNILTPVRDPNSTHVFHQYTIQVLGQNRDELKASLAAKGIPAMVYYPGPLHLQKAYEYLGFKAGDFPVAEHLCTQVISLPMHTELDEEQLAYICSSVLELVSVAQN